MKHNGYAGKRALVTGGSRGIGRAVTAALLEAGARVVACHLSESEAAEKLARELKESGRGELVQADVSQPDEVARLADRCREVLGGLDLVVNNAGMMQLAMLTELGQDDWRRMLDTNLTSVYLVSRAVLPLLAPGSAIVNVGSGVATVGLPARAHYTASKAGAIGLTRSLCKELGPRGIRVNLVAPGIVDTDLAATLTPEQYAQYARLSALGRLATPQDVADVVLFLGGDGASFVNGAVLPVDGGI